MLGQFKLRTFFFFFTYRETFIHEPKKEGCEIKVETEWVREGRLHSAASLTECYLWSVTGRVRSPVLESSVSVRAEISEMFV